MSKNKDQIQREISRAFISVFKEDLIYFFQTLLEVYKEKGFEDDNLEIKADKFMQLVYARLNQNPRQTTLAFFEIINNISTRRLLKFLQLILNDSMDVNQFTISGIYELFTKCMASMENES